MSRCYRVILYELKALSWNIYHVIRPQNCHLDCLSRFAPFDLIIENTTYFQQVSHELVFFSKIFQQAMDVLLWVLNNASQNLAHWFLVFDRLFVSVNGIWGGEQGQRCMNVRGMPLFRVLFYHEPNSWAALDYILRDHL